MDSITLRLAKERARHYLACKEILGLSGHDYSYLDLGVEFVKEAADMMNYGNELAVRQTDPGRGVVAFSLVAMAQDLGDRAATFIQGGSC